MVLKNCGQERRDLWTREWTLVDKIARNVGQKSGTCHQDNWELWKRQWTLVYTGETCGQESRDLWTNKQIVWAFSARFTDPVHSTYNNEYYDNSFS